MQEHKIYTANHLKGGQPFPFGKCRCGAYLLGQQEIDEHRELEKQNA